MRRRWFIRLLLLGLLMTAAIGWLLASAITANGLDKVHAELRAVIPLWTTVRLAVILGLLITWPKLLSLGMQCQWIKADHYPMLVKCRWRMAVCVIAIEVLFGLSVIGRADLWITG